MPVLEALASDINRINPVHRYGRVHAVNGLAVELSGPTEAMHVGSQIRIEAHGSRQVECEIVGFRADHAIAMPFARLEGVGLGARTVIDGGIFLDLARCHLARPGGQRHGPTNRRPGTFEHGVPPL